MAYAEKRDGKITGHWYGEVKLKATGERFRRRFDRKVDAEGYELYINKTGQEPPGLSGISGRTFSAVAKEAKDAGGPTGAWKRGRDTSVIQRLEFVCGTKLGRLPIEMVTYSAILDFVTDMEKRPGRMAEKMSTGTINRYLTAVSAVMTFAEAKGYIDKTPKVPWRNEQKQGRFHWLQEGQEDAIAAAMRVKGWEAEAFSTLVLVRTGLRWSEYAGLEPGQIDGKWIRLWDTKTDTPRSVPITHELARELRAFVASKALPEYKPYRTRLAHAVKSCGFDPELTPHTLRHTACTRLIMSGMPLPKVQRFMGHKSVETTMRYFHMLDDDLEDAAEILAPRRGNAAETAEVVNFNSLKNQKVSSGT